LQFNLLEAIREVIMSKNRGFGISLSEVVTVISRERRLNTRVVLDEIDLAINRGSLIYPLDSDSLIAIPGFIDDIYHYLPRSYDNFKPVEEVINDLCTRLAVTYPANLNTAERLLSNIRILIKLGYLLSNSTMEIKLSDNVNSQLIVED